MPGKLVKRDYGSQTWTVSLDVIRNPPEGTPKEPKTPEEPQTEETSKTPSQGDEETE